MGLCFRTHFLRGISQRLVLTWDPAYLLFLPSSASLPPLQAFLKEHFSISYVNPTTCLWLCLSEPDSWTFYFIVSQLQDYYFIYHQKQMLTVHMWHIRCVFCCKTCHNFSEKMCIFEWIKYGMFHVYDLSTLHCIHLSVPHVCTLANKLCFNCLSVHTNLQVWRTTGMVWVLVSPSKFLCWNTITKGGAFAKWVGPEGRALIKGTPQSSQLLPSCEKSASQKGALTQLSAL